MSPEARIARLSAALTKCGVQFAFYAREHRAAGKHEKAATNEGYARLCDEALQISGDIA